MTDLDNVPDQSAHKLQTPKLHTERRGLHPNHLLNRPRCLADCPASADASASRTDPLKQQEGRSSLPKPTMGSEAQNLISRLALTSRYTPACPQLDDRWYSDSDFRAEYNERVLQPRITAHKAAQLHKHLEKKICLDLRVLQYVMSTLDQQLGQTPTLSHKQSRWARETSFCPMSRLPSSCSVHAQACLTAVELPPTFLRTATWSTTQTLLARVTLVTVQAWNCCLQQESSSSC